MERWLPAGPACCIAAPPLLWLASSGRAAGRGSTGGTCGGAACHTIPAPARSTPETHPGPCCCGSSRDLGLLLLGSVAARCCGCCCCCCCSGKAAGLALAAMWCVLRAHEAPDLPSLLALPSPASLLSAAPAASLSLSLPACLASTPAGRLRALGERLPLLCGRRCRLVRWLARAAMQLRLDPSNSPTGWKRAHCGQRKGKPAQLAGVGSSTAAGTHMHADGEDWRSKAVRRSPWRLPSAPRLPRLLAEALEGAGEVDGGLDGALLADAVPAGEQGTGSKPGVSKRSSLQAFETGATAVPTSCSSSCLLSPAPHSSWAPAEGGRGARSRGVRAGPGISRAPRAHRCRRYAASAPLPANVAPPLPPFPRMQYVAHLTQHRGGRLPAALPLDLLWGGSRRRLRRGQQRTAAIGAVARFLPGACFCARRPGLESRICVEQSGAALVAHLQLGMGG